MKPVTRCKMRVSSVNNQIATNGAIEYQTVELFAVIGDTPENKEWSKWTPSANFKIQISNPAAMNKLATGHEFFVDFTPTVEPPVDAPASSIHEAHESTVPHESLIISGPPLSSKIL